jgi:hypoxanthine phosphoribosyltransferase
VDRPLPDGAPYIAEGLFLSEEEIQARVAELGRRITEDHAGREIVLVTVLRGGVFFLADLCRHIELPLRIDFMAVSSYAHGGQTGAVRITKDLDEDIEGATVLVVEDIIDTGMTLNYLLGVLRARGPAAIEIAVLLDRDVRRIVDLPIAYRGFRMPDRFIVGYGLDLRGRYRNLRYLASLPESMEGESC